MPLSLSRRREADTVTVTVGGEIDLSTVDALEREIIGSIGPEPADIVVDLAHVTFIDSAGIGTLLKGRRIAEEHGLRYRVTGAEGLVRQILDLTGVWAHLSGEDG